LPKRKHVDEFGREYGRIRDKLLDYFELLSLYYGKVALVLQGKGDLTLVDYDGSLYEGVNQSVAEILEGVEGVAAGYTQLPIQLEVVAEDSPGIALFDSKARGYLALPSWPSLQASKLTELVKRVKTYDREGFLPEQLLPDGIAIIDAKGGQLYSSFVADYIFRRCGATSVTGMAINQLLGKSLSETVTGCGVYYPRLDGFDVLVMEIPLQAGNLTEGYFYIFSDISMQKRSEKELIEKSTVIREIHHRVKNNLQTITSLLRLQIRRSNQRILEKSFNESINRILSIALIHEALSRQDIEVINVKQTSFNILQTILNNMVDPGKAVLGSVSGDDVLLPSETASSICLCITELIQNALEHAFIGRDEGNIRIDFSHDAGIIRIKVEDNGTGIKKQPEKSLGMEIVNTIVGRKLRGSFVLDSNRYGTCATIEFSDDMEHLEDN